MGTKLGGKPGSKKPFKPYNNAEWKSRPGKGGDGGRKQHKLSFSKDGKGPQKRKLPPFKVKREEEEGEITFYFLIAAELFEQLLSSLTAPSCVSVPPGFTTSPQQVSHSK